MGKMSRLHEKISQLEISNVGSFTRLSKVEEQIATISQTLTSLSSSHASIERRTREAFIKAEAQHVELEKKTSSAFDAISKDYAQNSLISERLAVVDARIESISTQLQAVLGGNPGLGNPQAEPASPATAWFQTSTPPQAQPDPFQQPMDDPWNGRQERPWAGMSAPPAAAAGGAQGQGQQARSPPSVDSPFVKAAGDTQG
jgi:hypothetical protein